MLKYIEKVGLSVHVELTPQAQRPGARDATIATTTLTPGSLQRMVRPRRLNSTKSLFLSHRMLV
jgi:hypothetical protein